MQNLQDLDRETSLLLDAIGAEPLAESGFEHEPFEPDFNSTPEGEREE